VKSTGSYLIDRSSAESAVNLALPMILEAMKLPRVGESGFLYIVIMNPGLKPASCAFEEAILFEYSIGDKTNWDADYATFARAKAKVSWRMNEDSHQTQELHPYLLQSGDTVLWGSVALEGIVVGVSGANPWYDEAFAGTIAMCLRAIAKERIQAARAAGLFLS